MNRRSILIFSFWLMISLIISVLIGSIVWNPEQNNIVTDGIPQSKTTINHWLSQSSQSISQIQIGSQSNIQKDDPYKEFKEYKTELVKIVNEQNPKIALEKLNNDISKEKVVQENCHSFTHAIGNATLIKFNNDIAESIKFNVDVCGGGYVHGIIEKYLQTKSNAGDEILTLCTDQNDAGCFHALGHGLMLMNKYDIVTSVDGCQKLSLSIQKVYCGEGIFMENFDSENAEDSEKPFLNTINPNEICPNYIAPYRDACFYYSGRFIFKSNKDPFDSLQLCKKAPSDQDSANCVRGMSAGIIRSDLTQPSKMEKVCNSIPDFYTSCLEGAVNYHLFMLRDESKTRTEMCDSLVNSNNQTKCYNLIKSSPFRVSVF